MGKTSRRFIPTGVPGGFPGEPPRMPPPGSYGTGGRPTRSPYKDDPPQFAHPSQGVGYQQPAPAGVYPGPGGPGTGGRGMSAFSGALPQGQAPFSPSQTSYNYPPTPSNLPYGVVPPQTSVAGGGGRGIYPDLPTTGSPYQPGMPYPQGAHRGSLQMPTLPESPGGGSYPSQPGMNPNYPPY